MKDGGSLARSFDNRAYKSISGSCLLHDGQSLLPSLLRRALARQMAVSTDARTECELLRLLWELQDLCSASYHCTRFSDPIVLALHIPQHDEI